MKPAPFVYHDPRSVDEIVERLAEHGDDAKVLAGGQSLMPMLALRLARPAVIVDVNRAGGLDGVLVNDGGVLHLGALVRQRAVERWARSPAPLLAAALRMVGHVAIRTRGTVAGSVVHGDPAAELPALFVALDGLLVARSRGGERLVPASELYLGPLTTALRSDELVVETRWPLPPSHAGWGFHEIARRHGDFALVGVFAVVTLTGGRVDSARIALFGVGPTPLRARDAEKSLAGAVAGAAAIADAARLAADALDPDSDIHASAWYRKRVARTLTERALTDALGRARSSG